MPARGRFVVQVLMLVGAASVSLTGSSIGVQAAAGGQHAQVSSNAHHDTSPALRDIKDTHTRGVSHPALRLPAHGGQSDTKGKPTAGHGTAAGALAPSTSTDWEGLGTGFSGFTVNAAPPDTDGAVGPSDYVQIVNEGFAVFSKTGTLLYGPVSTNTVFSGFGGLCQSDNDGDATVVYDRAANRFVISQFAVTGADGTTKPYLQCVAVSTSGDPTGSYYRYSFTYSEFPDYPKLGVWPDAYYTTFNLFQGGQTFTGAEVAAYNRTAMLSGQAATQQTFSTNANYGGLLPANVDSSALPAAGTPEWVVALGFDTTSSTTSGLAYWRYHVDWTTPANSTFTGPIQLSSQSYSELCGGGTCVPQSGTTQQLDSLADRIMYMVGYRNFGDHESLVVSHSVTAGSGGGIAWYELRPSGGALSVYQQGVYAPDSNYRWMPSLAMDGSGDIGVGFSLSGSSLHPAIHYTGRLATDPLNTMPQGESSIIDGAGSQTGNFLQALSRWGDYSQMSIDPSDDCTFWYTNQYEAQNGQFNWNTRIGSFKFAGCGSTTSDFSMGVTPSSQTVTAGHSVTYTVSTTAIGTAQTVSLSASGLPSGVTASFQPQSVTAGSSSTLTLTAASNAPASSSTTFTVTGTGTSNTHTATASVTVNAAPPPNDFSISISPTSQTATAGGSSITYTVSTAVVSGTAETISLAASGQPSGVTVSLNPTSVTAGNSSTMTVTATSSAAPGTYTLTVTGTAPSATHAATTGLTVASPPANDFSISVSPPTSQTVTAGNPATYTITTAVTSGSAQTVSLSNSGLPAGTLGTFNPSSVTAGQSSTLTVTTASNTAPGTYNFTIIGNGNASPPPSHSTGATLVVNAPANPIVNGGFESGSLTGWTTSGPAEGVTSTAHTGSFSAQLGSSRKTSGASSISQTFTVPSGATTLTFYYQGHCPSGDTTSQAWATATLKDNTTGQTYTPLLKTCVQTSGWTQVMFSLSTLRNDSVTLTLTSRDDNDRADGNYTLFDDVAVS
ncbi:MAG TPA: hypothetical protein VF137_07410 [Candidatus Dormibacteraeota bacterium]